MCDKDGYVREHRLIAEKSIGRTLDRTEVVHHKDGDRLNNHADNLEVMSQSEHMRLHEGLRKLDTP
jgi:hypothetical protein